MRKTSLLFATVWLCATVSMAQESTKDELKRDIGFNTQFVFQGILQSGSTPITIMYKKYDSPVSAWRFGLDLQVNLTNSDNDLKSINYIETNNLSISPSIGREYQTHFREHWTWYYGADVAPFFSQFSTKTWQTGRLVAKREGSNYGAQLRPLLGLRYNINERIYLAVEASLRLSYTRFSQEDFFDPGYNQTTQGKGEGSNFSADISPASGLYVFYRF